MVFERAGYKVTTAGSCAEALKILGNNGHFDAVVTDLNMETENIGLEVAQAAVAKRPKPAVVVCTGFANVGNSKEALNIGVDYIANKPVELAELISTLNKLTSVRDQKKWIF